MYEFEQALQKSLTYQDLLEFFKNRQLESTTIDIMAWAMFKDTTDSPDLMNEIISISKEVMMNDTLNLNIALKNSKAYESFINKFKGSEVTTFYCVIWALVKERLGEPELIEEVLEILDKVEE